jgi:DNA-binding response OmpR family regulator
VTREREITQIEQMRLGITDYVLKPLLWDELRACLRALMRGCGQGKPHRQARPTMFAQRASPIRASGMLRQGDLSIDLTRRRVLLRNQEIELTRPLLFDLLVYLVQQSGIALTRTQLLAQVWGYATPDELAGDTHTVSVHIHWLRQLLEEDPEHPQLIQTVRGTGYRFLGEVLSNDYVESTQALL